ncbi:MAG: DoxX family protein [Acidobacteria bacterium]|nr:DoxX family protein [Acidobacteriota bacterium]
MTPNAPLAATLLRLGLGTTMLAHGLLKVTVYTLPGTVAFFESSGFPGWLAYPVTAGEILGGIALLVGFLVRTASLALVPILAGATLTVAPNGWVFNAPQGGGWEFPAFLLLAAVLQALLGPGALALGNLFNRRPARA